MIHGRGSFGGDGVSDAGTWGRTASLGGSLRACGHCPNASGSACWERSQPAAGLPSAPHPTAQPGGHPPKASRPPVALPPPRAPCRPAMAARAESRLTCPASFITGPPSILPLTRRLFMAGWEGLMASCAGPETAERRLKRRPRHTRPEPGVGPRLGSKRDVPEVRGDVAPGWKLPLPPALPPTARRTGTRAWTHCGHLGSFLGSPNQRKFGASVGFCTTEDKTTGPPPYRLSLLSGELGGRRKVLCPFSTYQSSGEPRLGGTLVSDPVGDRWDCPGHQHNRALFLCKHR